MFDATNIVDLMNGPIIAVEDEDAPAFVTIIIGLMSCEMPKERVEDIDMWLHELIEYDMFLFGVKYEFLELLKGFPRNTPAHWVSSLLTGTNWAIPGRDWYRICSPEEYAEYRGLAEV